MLLLLESCADRRHIVLGFLVHWLTISPSADPRLFSHGQRSRLSVESAQSLRLIGLMPMTAGYPQTPNPSWHGSCINLTLSYLQLHLSLVSMTRRILITAWIQYTSVVVWRSERIVMWRREVKRCWSVDGERSQVWYRTSSFWISVYHSSSSCIIAKHRVSLSDSSGSSSGWPYSNG